jgi:hypothetical protein
VTDLDHRHRFGRWWPEGRVAMCGIGDCTAIRVVRGGQMCELSYDETIAVMAHQLEAIAIAQAMMMIHGRERGMRRAREALGYDRVRRR